MLMCVIIHQRNDVKENSQTSVLAKRRNKARATTEQSVIAKKVSGTQNSSGELYI